MSRAHDKTGRSTGMLPSRHAKKLRPPQDESWVWFTRTMLESPACRALSGGAFHVVHRIVIEQLAHGGVQNGELPVTYSNFVDYGVRRGSVREYLEEAITLGFIARTRLGVRCYGESKGASARYRLTWLPTCDGAPATNEWKRHKSLDDAKAAVARSLEKIRATRRPPKARPKGQSENIAEFRALRAGRVAS
jgi:hypothetical protein